MYLPAKLRRQFKKLCVCVHECALCACARLWGCVLGALERVEASNSLGTGVEIPSCE